MLTKEDVYRTGIKMMQDFDLWDVPDGCAPATLNYISGIVDTVAEIVRQIDPDKPVVCAE